jgi:hypothetical protein
MEPFGYQSSAGSQSYSVSRSQMNPLLTKIYAHGSSRGQGCFAPTPIDAPPRNDLPATNCSVHGKIASIVGIRPCVQWTRNDPYRSQRPCPPSRARFNKLHRPPHLPATANVPCNISSLAELYPTPPYPATPCRHAHCNEHTMPLGSNAISHNTARQECVHVLCTLSLHLVPRARLVQLANLERPPHHRRF